MSNLKIFLTGSNGYIGRNLLKRLQSEKGIEVSVHNRMTHPYSDTESLANILKPVDVVCHIGGVIKGSEEELLEGNTKNTLLLLKALSTLEKKPHLIFASSFAVYAVQNEKLVESTQRVPRNYYGLSKKMAEDELQLYSVLNNIPTTILRIANVYGPDMSNDAPSVIAYLMRSIKDNTQVSVNGDGTQTRDFIYIDDVVDAFTLAIKKRTTQDMTILNICSGEGTSINEIIDLFKVKFETDTSVTYQPQVQEVGCWVGDNSLAKEKLNWNPSVSIKKGIRFL